MIDSLSNSVAESGTQDRLNSRGTTGSRNTIIWFNVLIVACASVAYSNGITNGFTYNDQWMILNNPAIRDLSSLVSSLHLYRPVRLLTYAVDYQFWGLNPIGYHLSSLLLHAICSVLVFYVARVVIQNDLGALIAAVLFSVHPITTEAVDNISSRPDILGAIFSLLAFYCYVKRRRSRLFLLAVAPLHILAFMSKEVIAVSLPIMFIIHDVWFNRDNDDRLSFKRLLPSLAFVAISMLAIGGAFIEMRLGLRIREVFLGLSANTFEDSSAVLITLNVFVRAIAKGLLLLVCPRSLSADYPVPRISTAIDGGFVSACVVLLACVLVGILAARRSRMALFGLCWTLVFLLPASNIVPITGHFMAERYLYSPCIGHCLFVGTVLVTASNLGIRLCGKRTLGRSVLSVLLVLLVAFVVGDWERNRDWKSDHILWAKTTMQQPGSPVAHNNLGIVLESEGKFPDAIKEYRAAITILDGYNVRFSEDDRKKRSPSRLMASWYASTHCNIGISLMKQQMYKEAIPELEKAIVAAPRHFWPYYNLGVTYLYENHVDEAIDALTRSTQLNDRYAASHLALSRAYKSKGMLPEARAEHAKAMRLMDKATVE